MEDLKQNPPASIKSDAASEYMRGYSDGRQQFKEEIADWLKHEADAHELFYNREKAHCIRELIRLLNERDQ